MLIKLKKDETLPDPLWILSFEEQDSPKQQILLSEKDLELLKRVLQIEVF